MADGDVDPELLKLLGKKKIEQYYPGLAYACRKAYHLTIDAMREAAIAHGYCLAEHGSLARDIDLVAVPWTEEAVSAAEVAEAIRGAAQKASPTMAAFVASNDTFPRHAPHGRLCWSFHFGGGPYVDLSVMPRIASGPPAPPV